MRHKIATEPSTSKFQHSSLKQDQHFKAEAVSGLTMMYIEVNFQKC